MCTWILELHSMDNTCSYFYYYKVKDSIEVIFINDPI